MVEVREVKEELLVFPTISIPFPLVEADFFQVVVEAAMQQLGQRRELDLRKVLSVVLLVLTHQ